jgi:glycosyltransferase involved in cell wall biosynthesis
MRLAIITTHDNLERGGSEDLWVDLATEALRAGHQVAASIAGRGVRPAGLSRLQADGARLYPRWLPFGGRLQRLPAVYRACNTVIRPYRKLLAFNPDAVLFNLAHTPACTPLYDVNQLPVLLRELGIPYVAVSQLHDEGGAPIVEESRQRVLDFMRGAYRACFVSARNRDTVRRELADPLPNALVVRNPVNLNDRSAVPWPRPDQAWFACVARLATCNKGQELLLEALAAADWRDRDWELRLYGEGGHRDYLQRLTRYLGIEDRVKFKGFVGDIRQVWMENHIMVLPSRIEGTPLALVEAMLCGRPAVVTDVGGNAEWVEDNTTGFVAEAPSVRSFGAALERAWQARARWPEMGRLAHESAIAKADPSPGATLLKIICEAVAVKRRRS